MLPGSGLMALSGNRGSWSRGLSKKHEGLYYIALHVVLNIDHLSCEL